MKKKNYDNWLRNKKIIQSENVKKMPKKLKIFSLKILKCAGHNESEKPNVSFNFQ